MLLQTDILQKTVVWGAPESCNYNNSQLTTEISTEVGDTIFAERGHQKIVKVITLIKITEESVKFIETKSIQSNVKLRI